MWEIFWKILLFMIKLHKNRNRKGFHNLIQTPSKTYRWHYTEWEKTKQFSLILGSQQRNHSFGPFGNLVRKSSKKLNKSHEDQEEEVKLSLLPRKNKYLHKNHISFVTFLLNISELIQVMVSLQHGLCLCTVNLNVWLWKIEIWYYRNS